MLLLNAWNKNQEVCFSMLGHCLLLEPTNDKAIWAASAMEWSSLLAWGKEGENDSHVCPFISSWTSST